MTQEDKTREAYSAMMAVLTEHDMNLQVSVQFNRKGRIANWMVKWLQLAPRVQLIPAIKENNDGK